MIKKLVITILLSLTSFIFSEENNLKLSDKYIIITGNNTKAIFQLYDTTAANDLYKQLPLELNVTNFRNAQWMFYPPQKLRVKSEESYHDGKFGELSYYEPWGDVFMLYKDFYAGDEMHRLGINIKGAENMEGMNSTIKIEKYLN